MHSCSIVRVTFPLTRSITSTCAQINSRTFFHVPPTSILIWLVWSVIISTWLMSQKVEHLIIAQHFCKWLRVWEEQWETFKEVYYVRAKENHINSISGMKHRKSGRGQPLWNVFFEHVLCRLNPSSSGFIQDLSLETKSTENRVSQIMLSCRNYDVSFQNSPKTSSSSFFTVGKKM